MCNPLRVRPSWPPSTWWRRYGLRGELSRGTFPWQALAQPLKPRPHHAAWIDHHEVTDELRRLMRVWKHETEPCSRAGYDAWRPKVGELEAASSPPATQAQAACPQLLWVGANAFSGKPPMPR